MKVLNLLLTLLFKWIGSLEQRRKEQEQERHESNVDKLRENSADWFDGHFNGVRDNRLPDNASETNQANAGKPEANERRRHDTEQS